MTLACNCLPAGTCSLEWGLDKSKAINIQPRNDAEYGSSGLSRYTLRGGNLESTWATVARKL